MEKHEITYLDRGMEETESIENSNILGAIGQFYSEFGWHEILKIEVIE